MTRKTEQRDAIRAVLAEAGGPMSVQQVHDAASSRAPGLGVATVYRNLRALVEEGWLTEVGLPGDSTHFELADKDHHHHFECRKCGRVFDIPGCTPAVDRRLPAGFTVEHHEVLLFGRCADCATPAP
jgi:Fur family ferric uptake transcriptional regulator